MDDETKLLDDEIKEAEKNVGLAKAKDEKRRQIAALLLEEVDASFEKQDEALGLCREKIGLADALKKALGDQAHFEEIREDYKKQNLSYLLDQHLRFRIEEWLLQRKSEETEGETEDLEDEPNIVIEDEEFVYLQIPWGN